MYNDLIVPQNKTVIRKPVIIISKATKYPRRVCILANKPEASTAKTPITKPKKDVVLKTRPEYCASIIRTNMDFAKILTLLENKPTKK